MIVPISPIPCWELASGFGCVFGVSWRGVGVLERGGVFWRMVSRGGRDFSQNFLEIEVVKRSIIILEFCGVVCES